MRIFQQLILKPLILDRLRWRGQRFRTPALKARIWRIVALAGRNLWAARVSGSVFTEANVKAANLLATGLSKDFALSEFPNLKFSKKTTWDTELFKRNRNSVSQSHARTIEKEVKKRGFFSRIFSR